MAVFVKKIVFSTFFKVVADDLKVDRRAEEEKRRREEERKRQMRVEERPKRPSVPEKRPVQLQTELEDDWFILMGVSPKDYGMYHKQNQKHLIIRNSYFLMSVKPVTMCS